MKSPDQREVVGRESFQASALTRVPLDVHNFGNLVSFGYTGVVERQVGESHDVHRYFWRPLEPLPQHVYCHPASEGTDIPDGFPGFDASG